MERLIQMKKTPIQKDERKFYIKVGLIVFFIWVILFELVGQYAAKLPTQDITSFIDKQIPLIPPFIWSYMFCYIFPFLPIFIVKDYHRLNVTLLSIILANLSAFILYLLYPVAFPRPVLGHSLSEKLLSLLYKVDFQPGANKLPSLHVTFAWIVYLACRRQRISQWGEGFIFFLSGLITLSALFVKQHVIADIIVGIGWAFITWTLAGRLYKIFIDGKTDPQTGLRLMMKKITPLMFSFFIILLSIICFNSYRGQ